MIVLPRASSWPICCADVSTRVGIAPCVELPDARLQYLIGMEASVFAQHREGKSGDQRLRRVAEHTMACHKPCRELDLMLPVERIE
jgi:hypothetical protein